MMVGILMLVGLLAGIYFLPVILLAIVPNSYFGLTLAVLCIITVWLGLANPADLFSPKIMGVIGVSYLPAFLLKLYAIHQKKEGNVWKARLIPLFGLIGPMAYVWFFIPVSPALGGPKPSKSCVLATVKAEMAGSTFYLSPLAAFGIDVDDIGQPTDYVGICNKTNEGKEPLPVNSIDINFGKENFARDPYSAVCKTEKEWMQALCARSEGKAISEKYPEGIRIFGKGTGNGDNFPGKGKIDYDSSYEYYQRQLALTGEAAGATASNPDYLSLNFYRVKSSHQLIWVTTDPSWLTADGKPFTAVCRKLWASPKRISKKNASPAENSKALELPAGEIEDANVACTVVRPVSEKLAIRYHFSSTFAEMVATARNLDANVMAIYNDLLVEPAVKQ